MYYKKRDAITQNVTPNAFRPLIATFKLVYTLSYKQVMGCTKERSAVKDESEYEAFSDLLLNENCLAV